MNQDELDADLIIARLQGNQFAVKTPALWAVLHINKIEAEKNRPKNIKAMQDYLKARLSK